MDLPLPRLANSTLRTCITNWHKQKIPHGLLNKPRFLLVCLARYASATRGKNRIKIPCQALQQVSFPVFKGSKHDVEWTAYTLIAGILHQGPRPEQGHYRSFLAHPPECADAAQELLTSSASAASVGDRGISAPSGRPSAPTGSPPYTWWCTDDGKPATVCHPTYSRSLSENCYVLCFQLTDSL